MTNTETLVFRRSATGTYIADPDNTATEFQATIARCDARAYRVEMFTFGLLLESKVRRTLAECRTLAQQAFDTVEGVSCSPTS